jgi:hypothetical protein
MQTRSRLTQPFVLATATALAGLGIASFSPKASAADPALGAIIGGGLGAVIGHQFHHRNGAAVGGALGAIIGATTAADANRYYGYDDRDYYGHDRYDYDRRYAPAPSYGYYAPPAPVYYAPAYYAPAPYYGPSIVIGSSFGGHRHHRHHREWRHR